MEDYKGYSFFNDVENPVLRAWNRANTAINIAETLGMDEADKYGDNFDDVGLSHVKYILLLLTINGREEVEKEINKYLLGDEDISEEKSEEMTPGEDSEDAATVDKEKEHLYGIKEN